MPVSVARFATAPAVSTVRWPASASGVDSADSSAGAWLAALVEGRGVCVLARPVARLLDVSPTVLLLVELSMLRVIRESS
jgi:hypothetical protein